MHFTCTNGNRINKFYSQNLLAGYSRCIALWKDRQRNHSLGSLKIQCHKAGNALLVMQIPITVCRFSVRSRHELQWYSIESPNVRRARATLHLTFTACFYTLGLCFLYVPKAHCILVQQQNRLSNYRRPSWLSWIQWTSYLRCGSLDKQDGGTRTFTFRTNYRRGKFIIYPKVTQTGT